MIISEMSSDSDSDATIIIEVEDDRDMNEVVPYTREFPSSTVQSTHLSDVTWLTGSAITVPPRDGFQSVSLPLLYQENSNNGMEPSLPYPQSQNNSGDTIETNVQPHPTPHSPVFNQRDHLYARNGNESETVPEMDITVHSSDLPDEGHSVVNTDLNLEMPSDNVSGTSQQDTSTTTFFTEEAEQPDVVVLSDNPGIENPIIRLENPHFEADEIDIIEEIPPKRRKILKEEYALKSEKVTKILDDEDDGQTCPICIDQWTASGDHRLCCLKCGHLFGRSCIARWLSFEKKHCPQCNKKAYVKDIRNLYATKLIVFDNTEKEQLQKEIEKHKLEKKNLELKVTADLHKMDSYKEEINLLKTRIRALEETQPMPLKQNSKSVIKFHLEKIIQIKEGSCRVFAYEPNSNVLVVSHQSGIGLFPGFGIKKFTNIGSTFQSNAFIVLHQKMLRDLCFHPSNNDLVLSVGFDKCAKLCNITTNTITKSYKTDHLLWSCCWDSDDPNIFFTGSGNGIITQFDLRSNEPVSVITPTTANEGGPIIALCSAPSVPGKPLAHGGFLCCRLHGVYVYERQSPTEFSKSMLPLMGPFVSMSYDSTTQHILTSSRPNQNSFLSSHVFSQLTCLAPHNYTTQIVDSFIGGPAQKLLSRSCLINVNDTTLVAAADESSNMIQIWDTSTGLKVQSIRIQEPVISLISITPNGKTFLGALSEKNIRFYEVPLT